MPHISKSRMKIPVQEQVHDEFLSILTTESSPGVRKKLLQHLLTKTELTMLSKRLALIQMLGEGHTRYHIAHILRMSESTINRFYVALEENLYEPVSTRLTKRKNGEKFWETVERLSLMGMPPIGGRRKKKKNYLRRAN